MAQDTEELQESSQQEEQREGGSENSEEPAEHSAEDSEASSETSNFAKEKNELHEEAVQEEGKFSDTAEEPALAAVDANSDEAEEAASASADALADDIEERVSADDDASFDETLPKDERRLWETLQSRKCRVAEVFVVGNDRTKSEVILRELRNTMTPQTFGKLLGSLTKAHMRLQNLGIFEEISMALDDGDEPNTATVHVEVVEKGIFSANIGTYVQGKEQTAELKGMLKNSLGYAESLDVHVGTGASASSPNAFSLGFTLPRALYFLAGAPTVDKPPSRLGGLASFLRNANLEARLAESTRSFKEYSSHSQRSLGSGISLAHGPHNFAYDFTWRDNWGNPSSASCSPAVRRELGHSLLSSLRYDYVLDRRDSKLRPSRGFYLRSTSELAGIGTNPKLVRFFRQELELSLSRKLHQATRTTFSTGVTLGVLLPWKLPFGTAAAEGAAYGRPPLINDRFFLGGPSSLRGFRIFGVGPTDWRSREALAPEEETNQPPVDYLGGDIVTTASAALSFDLPFRKFREVGIHGHLFTSVGSMVSSQNLAAKIGSLNPANEHQSGALGMGSWVSSLASSLASELTAAIRWSAGAGLVWPTAFGRLEANYCVILKQQKLDSVAKHGFQIGFNTAHQ